MTTTPVRTVDTPPYIKNREPFHTHGSMSGEYVSVFSASRVGRLPEAQQEVWNLDYKASQDAGTDMYVVRSYDTPIAWWTEHAGWFIPQVTYTRTTSTKHQSRLWSIRTAA